MNKKSKFNFDEVVKIIYSQYKEEDILGTEGYIAGISKNDDRSWGYAVFLLDKNEVWDFAEQELKSTGKFYIEDEPRETIKVSVDKNGNGDLIE